MTASRPGRLSRLTPETQQALVAALRTGVTEDAACRASGVSRTSFYRWKARGRVAESKWLQFNAAQRTQEARYRDLVEAVQTAWDETHVLLADSILTAAVPHDAIETTVTDHPDGTRTTVTKTTRVHDWRAALAILERRHPDEWAKRPAQVEVTGAGGGPVEIAGVERARQALAQLEERLNRSQD